MLAASPSPINVVQLIILHRDMVVRWHQQQIENTYCGFDALVCQQHEYNFRLWHEEDKARDPNATDARIATVKRAIDRLNQQRNDAIERLDDAIGVLLKSANVVTVEDATLNTETPGSAIDRLSIMALRLYHYREQLDRLVADANHQQNVTERIATCEIQLADLACSLQQLLDGLFAGKKRHKTYRQMKMYNDATLNPEIYNRSN